MGRDVPLSQLRHGGVSAVPCGRRGVHSLPVAERENRSHRQEPECMERMPQRRTGSGGRPSGKTSVRRRRRVPRSGEFKLYVYHKKRKLRCHKTDGGHLTGSEKDWASMRNGPAATILLQKAASFPATHTMRPGTSAVTTGPFCSLWTKKRWPTI